MKNGCKGGQGRTDEEIEATGRLLCGLILAGILGLYVCIYFNL